MIRETRISQMSISSRRMSVTSRSNGPSNTSRSSSSSTGEAATAVASERTQLILRLVDEGRDVEVVELGRRSEGRAPVLARLGTDGRRGASLRLAARRRRLAGLVAEAGGDDG